MSNIVDFPKETQELYIHYKFKFFCDQVLSKYSIKQKEELLQGYTNTKKELLKDLRKNKKQTLFLIEGAVRKMHSGGLLPSLFHLDETREQEFILFKEIGENQAYFELWQKYKKRKINSERAWKYIVAGGSITGYLLAVIQIYQAFFHNT